MDTKKLNLLKRIIRILIKNNCAKKIGTMIKRVHIIVTGRVQGVGFRYTAVNWAKSLGLKGWVTNRLDSSVEIVAEGEQNAIEKLVAKIKSNAPGIVSECIVEPETPTGEFFGFEML
jgi:acylphosphatase